MMYVVHNLGVFPIQKSFLLQLHQASRCWIIPMTFHLDLLWVWYINREIPYWQFYFRGSIQV